MKLIVICLLTLSATGYARSELRELMYFPEKGTFWGETFFTMAKTNFEFINTDYEVDAKGLNQALNYTFSKNMKVGVGLSVKNVTTTPDGSDETIKKGMEDPILNFKYRVLWQSPELSNLDIGFNYTPSLIAAKDGDSDNEGNIASGRSELELFLALGKRVDSIAWELRGNFTFNGEGETEDADGDGETTYESNSSIGGSFSLQHFLGEKLSYVLSASMLFPGESKSENSSGTEITTKRYTFFGVGGQFLYSLSKDFYASFAYSMVFPGGKEIELDYGGTEYKYESYMGHAIAVKAAYNF